MRQDFLDAVGIGNIKGFEVRHLPTTGVNVLMVDNIGTLVVSVGNQELHKVNRAHLCEKLRDWFTEMYWDWDLTSTGLTIFKPIWHTGEDAPEEKHLVSIQDGAPLDWHLEAAMHVLANEVTP